MSSLYKGESGSWRTQSLFLERARSNDTPVFTLGDPVEGLISCRSTFVEVGDLTGYRWAMQYLGSWEHMERLMDIPWFSRAFSSWQRELIQKMKADALARLTDISQGNTNSAGAAAKFIVEEGWNGKTRGRPSKDEIAGNLKHETSKRSAEDLDMERIGLTLAVDNTKERHTS